MCAIFGLVDYKGSLTAVQRLRLIKALGTAAEVRGTDATGIAFFQRGKLCIQKAAKPAHKMRYRIPASAKVIMGHTRMTTQGSASRNQNNHPFPGNAGGTAFALAHNGVLRNDCELRYDYSLHQTDIETDSYVAVQLIEYQKELTFSSLRQMAETVEDSFVFTVLDQDNNLYFVKGDNPLTIYHYPNLGLYLYASTESILIFALEGSGLDKVESEVIEPENGEILMIDNAGRQSRSGFTMLDPFVSWSYPWEAVYAKLSRWGSQQQHIQDLKSVACYYGYTAEDIDNLLADGYAAADIEEMLYY